MVADTVEGTCTLELRIDGTPAIEVQSFESGEPRHRRDGRDDCTPPAIRNGELVRI